MKLMFDCLVEEVVKMVLKSVNIGLINNMRIS